jgi:hypothetical protein
MIAIDVDTVFADGADLELQPKANTGFWRAVLDAFTSGYYFHSGGNEVEPDEVYQEMIEAGIAEVTRVLNEG